jgi:penicillin-binding protein 1A
VHAEYVAEMARQLVYEQFKEDTYTRGLNVFTTITKADQDAAYLALRRGVMDYERRHTYRGPEKYIEIPPGQGRSRRGHRGRAGRASGFRRHRRRHRAAGLALAGDGGAGLRRRDQDQRRRPGVRPGLAVAESGRDPPHPPRRGDPRDPGRRLDWSITQMPEVESAFVAVSPDDGAIHALVGGFDFNRSKFNHVTQAWRQPGSSFKPFIYSASLERGFSPATLINDAPISFDAGSTGGQAWEPKNYDGKYEGPMTMRRGLTKSKNMISIRILNKIGARYGQEYATRFGFDADKNPPYLTLALGAGATTPLQMAGAYSVFANGGYRVMPYLISKVTDSGRQGAVGSAPGTRRRRRQPRDRRAQRLADGQHAADVARYGTAAKAQQALKRTDLAGKTGTTNDSIDAWFAGYQPHLVGIAWIGYDQPRNLGNKETGGGLALPIWIGFMQKALKDVPVQLVLDTRQRGLGLRQKFRFAHATLQSSIT